MHQALAAGHAVTALTRHPGSFPLRGDGLVVEGGDVLRPGVALRVVEGKDAVVSSLGVPYSLRPVSLFSESAVAVVGAMQQAGVRRIAAVTSSVLSVRSEGSVVLDHVVRPLLLHVVGRTAYADMRRLELALRASGLDWTVLRPAALADSPASGRPRIAEDSAPGRSTARADLAAVLLSVLEDPGAVRKVLGVATPGLRVSPLRVSPLRVIRESRSRA